VSYVFGVEEYVKNEVLVKFKDSTVVESNDVFKLHKKIDAKYRSNFKIFNNFQVITLPEGVSVKSAISFYEKSPFIEFAEPNYIYRAFDFNPDPFFREQWGLNNTGQHSGKVGADIDAIFAWGISEGSRDVVVAVIDTGVDYSHPDLVNNIWKNKGEVGQYISNEGQTLDRAKDGIDNDGNGFIDDVYGWNFYKKTNDPKDDHGHGTHCAGIIGASHNGIGIMGVAPNVSIMSLKFLGAAGNGTLEDGILATEYAILNGAHILSNSWGGDGYSKAMFDVIEQANKKGILYVAAAGNDHSNNDTQPTYPASYPNKNVVSVAASDRHDQAAYFTNWGKTSVHLAAPGMSIFSTIKDGQYKSYSGTSMACPHVAGAAAVLKSYFPEMSHVQIKERILSTTQRNAYFENLVASGGRLNLFNALANKVPEPEPDPTEWIFNNHQLSSPHKYPPLAKLSWTIHHPGAKFIKVHFKNLVTEKRVDYIAIKNYLSDVKETLSGNQGSMWTRAIEGDTLIIELRSDSINEFFGFEVDQYAVVLDES